MKNKLLILLVSLLAVPLSMIGALLGAVLTWILASFNRYEPLFDIYGILEPFIMGAVGGYVAAYVVMKIIKTNENFFLIVSLPTLITLLSSLPIFYDMDYTDINTLAFLASNFSCIAMYIYQVKIYESL